jgi:hypothetical protein
MIRAMSFEIRDATAADLPAVLAMNEAAVPHVNSLDPVRMQDLHRQAAWFRVVDASTGDGLCAFLIGLTPEADYASPNFLWFCRNYPGFAYIDRIIVAESARRHGLGSALYDDFEAAFGSRARMLACEVNLRPANPASMEFHRRRGFAQAGSQVIDNGNKEVAMMIKQLPR